MLILLFAMPVSLCAQPIKEHAVVRMVTDADPTDDHIRLHIKGKTMFYMQTVQISGDSSLFSKIAHASPSDFMIQYDRIESVKHVNITQITLTVYTKGKPKALVVYKK